MKKNSIFVCLTLLLQCFCLNAQNHRFVDPMIGSEGLGNVFIGPSCPYGMIKPGPDNDLNANSGFTTDMKQPIYGFSQVHVSGTGGGAKYGNVSIMPISGDFESIKQESLRDNDKVALGYYSTVLKKWNIQTEITNTILMDAFINQSNVLHLISEKGNRSVYQFNKDKRSVLMR